MNASSEPRAGERPGPQTPADQGDTGEFVIPGDGASRFYSESPTERVRVEVAGRSDPGKVRPTNEDHFIAVRRCRGREVLATSLPPGTLVGEEDYTYTFAVADGMGGRDFGELASLLALKTGWELGADEIKWTVKLNDREEEELKEKAEVFFQLIHQTLHAAVRENPRLAGMGTTLTLGYSTGPELFVMHAGDSRTYLLRGSVLTRLTHDHNMAQLLVDAGAAAAGSKEARKMRHVLTNCLGGQTGTVEVDVRHVTLRDGDRLLFCSDGLNDMLTDAEIGAEIARHPAAADACDALIALALERGGRDNITALIAHYIFEGQGHKTAADVTPVA